MIHLISSAYITTSMPQPHSFWLQQKQWSPSHCFSCHMLTSPPSKPALGTGNWWLKPSHSFCHQAAWAHLVHFGMKLCEEVSCSCGLICQLRSRVHLHPSWQIMFASNFSFEKLGVSHAGITHGEHKDTFCPPLRSAQHVEPKCPTSTTQAMMQPRAVHQ